jgi:hypothetical protein
MFRQSDAWDGIYSFVTKLQIDAFGDALAVRGAIKPLVEIHDNCLVA